MNKTLLIIVGIFCAMIAAAGIIAYSPTHNKPDDYYGNSRMHFSLNELIKHLNNEEEGMFDCGCMLAEYSGAFNQFGEKSIPELINFLKDKKWWLRCIAVMSLGSMKAKESMPEIIVLLNDQNSRIRASAIDTLSQLGDRKVIPQIRAMLNDPEGTVKYHALEALMEFNDKESMPAIKKLLKDEEEYVRDYAEQALLKFGATAEELEKAKEGNPDAEKFKAIEEFYRKAFPDSHFIGGGVFTDGPSDNMRYHIFVPKEIESLYLYPYSESFLKEQSAGDDRLKIMIADNLLQLRHGVLFKRPGATVSYDGGKHNIECIDYVTPLKYYILDHPSKEFILDIKQLIRDEDKNVREQAEQALRKLGVPDSEIEKAKADIINLREQLRDEDASVRRFALFVLFNSRDKESIPEIKKLLNDEDERVREEAKSILEYLGVPAEELEKAKENK